MADSEINRADCQPGAGCFSALIKLQAKIETLAEGQGRILHILDGNGAEGLVTKQALLTQRVDAIEEGRGENRQAMSKIVVNIVSWLVYGGALYAIGKFF